MKHTGLASRWRKQVTVCIAFLLLFTLFGCAKTEATEAVSAAVNDSLGTVAEDTALPEKTESTESQMNITSEPGSQPIPKTEDTPVKTDLILKIDGQEVYVAWEDNESVTALREFAEEAPIAIQMSMYGGFEQVGPIGTSLPRDDVQTTTEAGDIMLYSGNQIVVFYGSNSWAYTRLGRIDGLNSSELTSLLGNGAVELIISVE
ncbi:MAG: hypothetical protein IKD89_01620 [Clostridia bacterium]|nr:hypothetical protein [Clostridia bacterium]